MRRKRTRDPEARAKAEHARWRTAWLRERAEKMARERRADTGEDEPYTRLDTMKPFHPDDIDRMHRDARALREWEEGRVRRARRSKKQRTLRQQRRLDGERRWRQMERPSRDGS